MKEKSQDFPVEYIGWTFYLKRKRNVFFIAEFEIA